MASQWYYAQGGQQRGPVSQEELNGLVRSGGLRPDDMVWNESLPNWVPARQVLQFQQAGGGGGGAGGSPAAAVVLPGASTYQPPQQQQYQASPSVLGYQGPSGEGVTQRSLEMLQATKPWVRLFSVLLFIGASMGILFGLGLMFAGAMVFGRAAAWLGMVAGIIVIAFSMLYFMPALFLGRYASRIGDAVGTRRSHDLEAALEAQKSFWKFIGIVTTVYLCLNVGMFLLAFLSAAMR
jgi:hypothetical protein